MNINQKGNALFLILIAVALFAALSYAVTQSGGGGGTIDKETALIDGAKLTQYAGQVQQAVQRMRLINGCSETEISFDDTAWGHTDYQHTPVVADECKVFSSTGGGVPFPDVPSTISSLPWEFEGGLVVHGSGTDTYNTSGTDLVMYLPGLSLQMCNSINKALGLGFSSIPIDASDTVEAIPSRFNGDYTATDNLTGQVTVSTCPGMPLCYKPTACFQEETGNQYYIFYQLLIAR